VLHHDVNTLGDYIWHLGNRWLVL